MQGAGGPRRTRSPRARWMRPVPARGAPRARARRNVLRSSSRTSRLALDWRSRLGLRLGGLRLLLLGLPGLLGLLLLGLGLLRAGLLGFLLLDLGLLRAGLLGFLVLRGVRCHRRIRLRLRLVLRLRRRLR